MFALVRKDTQLKGGMQTHAAFLICLKILTDEITFQDDAFHI